MTDQEPPAKHPPRVRLWLVSLLLFAAGFVGKLVLEGGKPPDQGYPVVMLWQTGWYAGGLVAWVWWASTRPVGETVGCWAGAALVAFAVVAVMFSSPK